ncbi:MAG TPA: 4-hydroxy-tetrahydrodipicolinate reductase [Acidimicrobiales bacterium]|nr:4-hydroxy-tetrahydrodipicolinate reductase [Acidimicrobiales bacterium]
MRVGVVGAGGKMGREVCGMVAADPELELVAAVDPECVGQEAGGLAIVGDLGALADAGSEVVVDFTRVAAARSTLAWCAEHGLHAVVGTTGFDERDMADLRRLFAGPEQGAPNCVVAANFAIGAVLMMRFAEIAAPWFDGAEIVELHHEGKLDAPSGTSIQTAERMAAARVAAGMDPYPGDATTTVMVEGARGGAGPGGVRMHSVRLTGLVAHQEVLFGSPGQGLSIRHDSYQRTSFMAGVALAVKAVAARPGLTLGLEPLLGF